MSTKQALIRAAAALATATTATLTIAPAASAAPPIERGTAKADVEVTIQFGGADLTEWFQGRVKSPKADCEEQRRVDLFHKIGGDWKKEFSDKTNNAGAWKIYTDDYGQFDPGDYRAKVRSNGECQAAKSKVYGR